MQRGRLEESLGRIIDFYKYYPQQMDVKTVDFLPVDDIKGEFFYPLAMSFYIASKTYLNEVIKSFRSKGALEIAKLTNLVRKESECSSQFMDLIKLSEIIEKEYVLDGFPEFTTLKIIESRPIEVIKYRLKDIKYFLKSKGRNTRIEGYNFLKSQVYPKYNSNGVLFLAGLVGTK